MKFLRQPIFDPDYTVTKDGKPLDLVRAADEEAGEALILCVDWEGSVIPDGSDFGYQTILVKGEIKITPIKRPEKAGSDYTDPSAPSYSCSNGCSAGSCNCNSNPYYPWGCCPMEEQRVVTVRVRTFPLNLLLNAYSFWDRPLCGFDEDDFYGG